MRPVRGCQRHRLAKRPDRLARLAGFQQDLPLQLMEIGVVRHAADQVVDGAHGLARAAGAIGDDRARILGGEAVVGARVAAPGRRRAFGEGGELRPHHIVAELQLGAVFRGPELARLGRSPQLLEAVARHRMALRVGVDILRRQELLVGEALEHADHARGGLAGGVQIGEGRAVGGKLLRAAVGEQRAHRYGGAHA